MTFGAVNRDTVENEKYVAEWWHQHFYGIKNPKAKKRKKRKKVGRAKSSVA